MLAKVFTYTFGAGATKTLPGGRFLRLLSVTSPVDIEFFDENGSSMGICEDVTTGFAMSFYPLELGKDAPLISFGKVQITSAAAQDVQVAISRQPIDWNAISGNVNASLTKPSTAADQADVSLANGATDTIAASTTRHALIIGSKSTNSGNLRTGPAAAAARGRELQPGLEHVWNTTAAIKIHNDSGAAQDYSVASESD